MYNTSGFVELDIQIVELESVNDGIVIDGYTKLNLQTPPAHHYYSQSGSVITQLSAKRGTTKQESSANLASVTVDGDPIWGV